MPRGSALARGHGVEGHAPLGSIKRLGRAVEEPEVACLHRPLVGEQAALLAPEAERARGEVLAPLANSARDVGAREWALS